MEFKKLLVVYSLCFGLSACDSGGKSSPRPQASSVSFSSSSTAASSASSASSVAVLPQAISELIVVDQFGYLPELKKIAIIRDPQMGYDAEQSINPGSVYQVVNAATGEIAFSGSLSLWNNGATHPESGDKVWWFDFSSLSEPGTYAVVDPENNLRSPEFSLGTSVYRPVLKHALRSFFYQRSGFAKQLPYAEPGWTDEASHLGPGQDANARLYNATEDGTTERDLSGGWYDADEYNKYTNRHGEYLIGLLLAYRENPAAWTDDIAIPESGNGIPDIIDEVKWGLDWLIKMQAADGSLLSLVGVSHASPPSAATGPSRYGPASTSATLTGAAAFALASEVLGAQDDPALVDYAANLAERALAAWQWAETNPAVVFQNNTATNGSQGLGDIQQEVNDGARANKKLLAAIYLFAATGDPAFRDDIDAQVNNTTFTDVTPWNQPLLDGLLYYAVLPDATESVAETIIAKYTNGMEAQANLPAVRQAADAYRVPLGAGNFTWGSNRTLLRKAATFYHLLTYDLGGDSSEIRNAALAYLNYLHGTNPFGLVYLSNMASLGAHRSVNEVSHAWFSNGSPEWDRVGISSYGPAPGFIVVGPNPDYATDACCPSSCQFAGSNTLCTSQSLTPPKDQPPMKSYLDFNTGWPLNSWQVAEVQNDHQVAYLRLLSKFVAGQ